MPLVVIMFKEEWLKRAGEQGPVRRRLMIAVSKFSPIMRRLEQAANDWFKTTGQTDPVDWSSVDWSVLLPILLQIAKAYATIHGV